jgi:hypothetical protein
MGLAPVLSAVWKVASGIPLSWWICIALALGLATERHGKIAAEREVTLIKAQDADAKIEALRVINAVNTQRNQALQGEVDVATKRAAVAAADAASSAAATAGLSVQLARVRRQLGAASSPSASPDLDAARSAVGVLADMLGERERADAARSRFADEAWSAASGCAGQYRSLR